MSNAWRQPYLHGASCPDGNCVGSEGGEYKGTMWLLKVTDGLGMAKRAPGQSGFTGRKHKDERLSGKKEP